jgi:hypothetical protein
MASAGRGCRVWTFEDHIDSANVSKNLGIDIDDLGLPCFRAKADNLLLASTGYVNGLGILVEMP